MVLATQNPIEYEGTFPLPEAQLDRFLLRMSLGYPSQADEVGVLNRLQFAHPVETLAQVVSVEELLAAQEDVKAMHVEGQLKNYIVEIVTQTRKHPDVYLGASPRGSLALFRASQARAAVLGRDYVIPDDVKALAESALAHRVIIGPAARIKDINSRSVIRDILSHVPVPGGSLIKK
jgi:MoxR-like ATPase